MTYAFSQDVPIDAATYKNITEGIGDEPIAGLITHIAIERPEGGLRYIDVWESEEDWDRFANDRLHPVVNKLLEEVFGQDLPEEPARTELSVIDVRGASVGA